MTIQVFTRSNNDQLYDLMRSLIPAGVECIKVTGYDHWTQAADYLYYIIDHGAEWVINVDIDCFIYDWRMVEQIVGLCRYADYTHAGCRDGGELKGRYHSWVHQNPFFNVFNPKKIRELKGSADWKTIEQEEYDPEWETRKPEMLLEKVFNDREEPFAGFFYWLYRVGRPYYCGNTLHPDKISTVVEKAMIHTWYSREFDHGHGERIMARFEEAKVVRDMLNSGINLKQLI